MTQEIARREGALLADLKRFVAISTGPDHAGAAGLDELRGVMTARLTALGAACRLVPGEDRPGWLASWRATEGAAGAAPVPPTAVLARPVSGGRRLLLAGHLDTVHEYSAAFGELSIAPGGKTATGPGCVDMKGGLVIALHALEALEVAGEEVGWTFVLNSDEETGSYHSDTALRAEASRHDIGMALEPAMAGGELALTRGGSGQFAFACRGSAAHVGRDFTKGVSAVDALARAVVAAHGLSDPSRGVCVSVGPLRGGHATNVVPDQAMGWGNVRFPDAAAEGVLRESLGGLARGDASAGALPEVRVLESFNRPAKPLTAGTERLALAARAAAEDLGQSLPFAASSGVCDGNNLQDAGLATIDTLGVRGGGLHTLNEWIELASLVERCQLLAVLMMRERTL
jgi:glutamate carboxypeptidase